MAKSAMLDVQFNRKTGVSELDLGFFTRLQTLLNAPELEDSPYYCKFAIVGLFNLGTTEIKFLCSSRIENAYNAEREFMYSAEDLWEFLEGQGVAYVEGEDAEIQFSFKPSTLDEEEAEAGMEAIRPVLLEEAKRFADFFIQLDVNIRAYEDKMDIKEDEEEAEVKKTFLGWSTTVFSSDHLP